MAGVTRGRARVRWRRRGWARGATGRARRPSPRRRRARPSDVTLGRHERRRDVASGPLRPARLRSTARGARALRGRLHDGCDRHGPGRVRGARVRASLRPHGGLPPRTRARRLSLGSRDAFRAGLARRIGWPVGPALVGGTAPPSPSARRRRGRPALAPCARAVLGANRLAAAPAERAHARRDHPGPPAHPGAGLARALPLAGAGEPRVVPVRRRGSPRRPRARARRRRAAARRLGLRREHCAPLPSFARRRLARAPLRQEALRARRRQRQPALAGLAHARRRLAQQPPRASRLGAPRTRARRARPHLARALRATCARAGLGPARARGGGDPAPSAAPPPRRPRRPPCRAARSCLRGGRRA